MEGKRKEFLSVIIPAFNESGRIVPTLHKIAGYCDGRFAAFEIIVVNDGSSDDTTEVVTNTAREIGAIRLFDCGENRGKGYAVRQGVSSSRGDIILISDADLSTPIEEVEKLLSYYEGGYSIVIGSRALDRSQIIKRQAWYRETMGKIFNRLVRSILPFEFKDTQCGFKLFDGPIGKALFGASAIDGFAFDVEILFRAQRAGYAIKEVPVKWINSPASRVNPLLDSLQMAKDLIRIRLKR